MRKYIISERLQPPNVVAHIQNLLQNSSLAFPCVIPSCPAVNTCIVSVVILKTRCEVLWQLYDKDILLLESPAYSVINMKCLVRERRFSKPNQQYSFQTSILRSAFAVSLLN